MPLFAVGSTTPITELPLKRRKFFNDRRPGISDADYAKIEEALNAKFDEQKPFNSSHVPGETWVGGPYAPILAACNGNEIYAGFLFGLIVWEVARNRNHDTWHFYKPDAEGDDIKGTTYFPN